MKIKIPVVTKPTIWTWGYARVSTRDQNLDMQVAALERYGCDHILSEKLSATSKNRPELAKIWRELRDGDTLVVWRLDRLARNSHEMHVRMHELTERGVRLVSLTENIDTKSASGRFMLSVLAAVAQMERDMTSERTSAGIKTAQEEGRAHAAWTKKFDRKHMKKALLGGETPEAYAKRHKVTKSAVYKAMDDDLRRVLRARAMKRKKGDERRGRRLKVQRRNKPIGKRK